MMILRKPRYTVSIVNQLMFLMLLLGVIALSAMSISNWIANDTKGSAYTINQLGTLRMKSYQLLSFIPLTTDNVIYLSQFDSALNDPESGKKLNHYQLVEQYKTIQSIWYNSLSGKLKTAKQIAEVRPDVIAFVNLIDQLVHAVDQYTEQQIIKIVFVQKVFIALIIIFLILLIIYLRYRLLQPWKRLVNMAIAIANRNFNIRYQNQKNQDDEFGILGLAFNHMSKDISMHYASLEQRVNEKTIELQKKNEIVTFLYNAIQKLHTTTPICERFLSILQQLEKLIPLTNFKVCLYEAGDQTISYQFQYGIEHPPTYCQYPSCSVCLKQISKTAKTTHQHYWYLENNNKKYGMISAIQTDDLVLSDEHNRLIARLFEQMTMALVLEQQLEYQKQLALMQERSAIARELHDSIAQSLSCLKLQISCLKLNNESLSAEGHRLLEEMRRETNMAYSQLRELLTTFRLNMNKMGLYASLQSTVDEFSKKLGFTIKLNYQIPLNILDSHQAIHLLQISREALNNIYKHAHATHVELSLTNKLDQILLIIKDNGIGMPESWYKTEHYGVIIMKDRTEHLHGQFSIESKPNQGTVICVIFKPQS